MDREVTAKIKEFSKATGVKLDDSTLQYNFYILSAPSSFSLTTVRATRFEEWKERRRLAALDPVLFYKIDNTHYRLIHQWGKDFSAWRRILGYRWLNQHTYRLTNFFFAIPVVSLLFSLLLPVAVWYRPLLTTFGVLFISAFSAWLLNLMVVKEGGIFESTSYNENFFTPQNWNSTEKLVG